MFTTIINFAKSFITKKNIEKVLPAVEEKIEEIVQEISDNEIPTNNSNIAIDESNVKNNLEFKKIFPFVMFYGNNEFQPIYFWVTLFSSLVFLMLFIKIYNAYVHLKQGTFTTDMISTSDLGIGLGFVSSLILLYNSSKSKSNKQIKFVSDNKEGDGQL